jgi:hypothetical protein
MPIPTQPTAVSMNRIIDKIYARLGVSNRSTEIKDDDLMKTIVEETLPVYSKYYPLDQEIKVLATDLVPGESGKYYINSVLPIMGINKVIGGIDSRVPMGLGALGRKTIYRPSQPMFPFRSESPMPNLVETYEIANIHALTYLPITCTFLPPNIIEIFPKNTASNFAISIKCVHPSTLHTIPFNMEDYFFQLAYYDVLINNKAILKKFQNIASIYGEIQLNTEDMDAAEDKRNELIEKFRTKSMFRPNRTRWYFA